MSEENFCEDPRHGDSVKLYCQICLSSKLREAKKIAEQRGLERAFQSHINHLEDTTSLKGCHFCEAYEKGRASVRKEHRIDCHDCCKEHYEDGQRDGRAEGIAEERRRWENAVSIGMNNKTNKLEIKKDEKWAIAASKKKKED